MIDVSVMALLSNCQKISEVLSYYLRRLRSRHDHRERMSIWPDLDLIRIVLLRDEKSVDQGLMP